jgi:hypothetical protein
MTILDRELERIGALRQTVAPSLRILIASLSIMLGLDLEKAGVEAVLRQELVMNAPLYYTPRSQEIDVFDCRRWRDGG